VLAVADLVAGYGGGTALHGVDLTVPAGRVYALVGRNGTGKTTLLRTVMGQLAVRHGRVRFGTRDITGLATHVIARLGVGYVPQGRGLFGHLTVAENLRLALLGHRIRPPRVPARVLDWFPRLAERLEQPAGTLSGGEQQFLALGRALASAPAMLLLDEPTGGLQPAAVAEIGAILARIVRESGLTVLLVEQNLDLALRLADEVGVMAGGRIVASYPVAAARAERTLLTDHLAL